VSAIEQSYREIRKLHSSLDNGRGSTWWAPGAVGWWVGVLFAIGATLFALGAAPGFAHAVGFKWDAAVFFSGSIFFTSAAFLQYLESVNARRRKLPGKHRIRVFVWEPRNLAWWSSLVQLAGTIYFNVSTFHAIWTELLKPSQVDHLVWKPDIYGSICFLIASTIAWVELGHVLRAKRPRTYSWWIVYLNLTGSVFFGISGIASFVLPTTNHVANKVLVDMGTFVGALCFLAGAIILLPERTQEKLG
jgi:hypothetical protein